MNKQKEGEQRDKRQIKYVQTTKSRLCLDLNSSAVDSAGGSRQKKDVCDKDIFELCGGRIQRESVTQPPINQWVCCIG